MSNWWMDKQNVVHPYKAIPLKKKYEAPLMNLKHTMLGFPGSAVARMHLPAQEMQETQVLPLGREDPLEEEMATHSSVLAWRTP